MQKGSCLCGSIRYEIDGELSDFGYCHCKSCRKASGSAYGANIGVVRNDLTLTDPKSYLKEFRVFAWKTKGILQQLRVADIRVSAHQP